LLAFHSENFRPHPVTSIPPSTGPQLQQPEIPHARTPPPVNAETAVPEQVESAALAPELASLAPLPPTPSTTQAPLRMGFAPVSRPKVETPPAMASNPTAPVPRPASQPAATGAAGVTPLLNVPLRLIGVVGKLYVLLESDRGLVLLDQHAAHERILFEQMLARLEHNGTTPSQKLLLPETIELPPRDAQFLREQLTALTRLGVGLSEFGERTFLLDSLPPFVRAPDPRRFVFDLVDELRAAGREVNLARLGEHTVAKTVCRHAVKANDFLADAELENLIADLRQCAMPYTCPHGRPTLIEMNYRELEKKFGRTQ
jgi:DNA mismatch repair protein MutL